MSIEKLINKGFEKVIEFENGLSVYAKLTGYEDNIQYYLCRNGESISNSPQVISYQSALMFEAMAQYFEDEIEE